MAVVIIVMNIQSGCLMGRISEINDNGDMVFIDMTFIKMTMMSTWLHGRGLRKGRGLSDAKKRWRNQHWWIKYMMCVPHLCRSRKGWWKNSSKDNRSTARKRNARESVDQRPNRSGTIPRKRSVNFRGVFFSKNQKIKHLPQKKERQLRRQRRQLRLLKKKKSNQTSAWTYVEVRAGDRWQIADLDCVEGGRDTWRWRRGTGQQRWQGGWEPLFSRYCAAAVEACDTIHNSQFWKLCTSTRPERT